jgi:hypothetical protein
VYSKYTHGIKPESAIESNQRRTKRKRKRKRNKNKKKRKQKK